jgi:hypothetical protein
MTLFFHKEDIKKIVYNILSNEKDESIKDDIAEKVISTLIDDNNDMKEISILTDPASIARETIFEYNNLYGLL